MNSHEKFIRNMIYDKIIHLVGYVHYSRNTKFFDNKEFEELFLQGMELFLHYVEEAFFYNFEVINTVEEILVSELSEQYKNDEFEAEFIASTKYIYSDLVGDFVLELFLKKCLAKARRNIGR